MHGQGCAVLHQSMIVAQSALQVANLEEAAPHHIVNVVSHSELCVERHGQVEYSVDWRHGGAANRQR